MNQYQIFSKPRHMRYMFFIDVNYPYDKLLKLINHNQRLWGGRYNPIVPVKDGTIVKGYMEIIKYYDPDYIFYSDNVDPEIIRKLRFFNPAGYCNLDKQPREEDISGVDALYFVSQFDRTSNVLMPEDIWKTESPLLEYYRTNFGLPSSGISSDYEITKNFNQIPVTVENFSTLNEIIHRQKPINQALLSKRNLNTKGVRNLQSANYNSFEIVIAKDKTSITDLLYYWNRQLYECRNLLYVTVEELSLLTQDKYFGGVLYDLSGDNTIDVVSFTLTKEETEKIIQQQLNKIAFHRRFQYKDVSHFPFEVLDDKVLFSFMGEGDEPTAIQTLLSEKNLLLIPKLSFTEKVGFYPQRWAVDIQITRVNQNGRRQLNFPLTTDTKFIIRSIGGRVDRTRNISFFVHNQQNTSGAVEMRIPEFTDLLYQLIKNPVFHGEIHDTKYVAIGPHDSSNRMNAFIKTFDSDFSTIDKFFTDKFWMDIFEDLCTSEKAAGDAISFQEILTLCIKIYEENMAPLGEKGETYENPENLSLGLQEIVKDLCELSVFLQGFKLKCPRCSSIFWYHLKETGSKVNCKGCLEDFNMPVESAFHYKLNDLIKNNIFQSKTQRDGNLTVIRTLASLKSRLFTKSFAYSDQLNLYDDFHKRKPVNEIDVIALAEGKLIIGEAKHNSKEFSANKNKSLNALIEVAKDIRPDKLILSCYTDEHNKLENARKYVAHHFKHDAYAPEIEVLLLQEPDYFRLGGAGYFYY